MKKVLVLTVIAILALGVMALADGNSNNGHGNSNLVLTGTFNIKVDQWIDGTLTPNDVEFSYYGDSEEEDVFSLKVTTNGEYKIFMENLAGLPTGISVVKAKLEAGSSDYIGTSASYGSMSGYMFDNNGSPFSANESAGTTYEGYITFKVLSTTSPTSGNGSSISLNITIISASNF